MIASAKTCLQLVVIGQLQTPASAVTTPDGAWVRRTTQV